MPRKSLTHDEYNAIMRVALKYCACFTLIVRKELNLSAQGAAVLEDLAKFMLQEMEVDKWPGTILYGHTAIIRYYALSRESVTILSKYGVDMLKWQQPAYPEDLCLMRNDRTPWMVAISHENDLYFELDENEYLDLSNCLFNNPLIEDPASTNAS